MKKYISRATKWLASLAIISTALLIIGVILIFAKSPYISLEVELTALSGSMSILFFLGFLGERSRWLTIDADEIILPRGVVNNGKLIFGITVVKINEIEGYLHAGAKAVGIGRELYAKKDYREIIETAKNVVEMVRQI